MVPRTVEPEHPVMDDDRVPRTDPTSAPSEVPRLLERTSSARLHSAISSRFRTLSNCLSSLDLSPGESGLQDRHRYAASAKRKQQRPSRPSPCGSLACAGTAYEVAVLDPYDTSQQSHPLRVHPRCRPSDRWRGASAARAAPEPARSSHGPIAGARTQHAVHVPAINAPASVSFSSGGRHFAHAVIGSSRIAHRPRPPRATSPISESLHATSARVDASRSHAYRMSDCAPARRAPSGSYASAREARTSARLNAEATRALPCSAFSARPTT